MGKVKGLVALVIVLGGIYVGWKMIPPYFHYYEFRDDLDDIARRNSYTRKTDDEVRASVIQQASSYDIPLKEEQVSVSRNPDGMGISVQYHIHVDMVVHPVDLDFTANSLNKRAY
jgi:hypothetical protein